MTPVNIHDYSIYPSCEASKTWVDGRCRQTPIKVHDYFISPSNEAPNTWEVGVIKTQLVLMNHPTMNDSCLVKPFASSLNE